jgi:pimeloyl-ACP methyl ester carboxylesterase
MIAAAPTACPDISIGVENRAMVEDRADAPRSLRVPGAHDLSLHVLEWSRGGPPLLFLHGFGHSARIWQPFALPLARCYRSLALDQRGHGDSDRDPEYRYHHAAIARDLEVVLDHLEIESVVLVSHSMGGYASLRFAARHPQRVAKLVLVDAGPELSASSRATRGEAREPRNLDFAGPDDYTRILARLYPRARVQALAELAPHWLRQRADGRFEPKLDPAFLRPKSAADPDNRRKFDRQAWARQEEARLWDCLSQVSCPTLVVRGALSPYLSQATVARMVDEVLPDGRSITVPDAGHVIMLENPEALNEALSAFLLPEE